MDHLCFRIEPFDRSTHRKQAFAARHCDWRNRRALRRGRHRFVGLFQRSRGQSNRAERPVEDARVALTLGRCRWSASVATSKTNRVRAFAFVWEENGNAYALGDSGRVLCCLRDGGGTGLRAEVGRHAAHLPSRQSAERLDPRGIHHLGEPAVHGGVQQPRRVRSEREGEQPRPHRARPGRELVLQPDQHAAHLQAAPGREVA